MDHTLLASETEQPPYRYPRSVKALSLIRKGLNLTTFHLAQFICGLESRNAMVFELHRLQRLAPEYR